MPNLTLTTRWRGRRKKPTIPTAAIGGHVENARRPLIDYVDAYGQLADIGEELGLSAQDPGPDPVFDRLILDYDQAIARTFLGRTVQSVRLVHARGSVCLWRLTFTDGHVAAIGSLTGTLISDAGASDCDIREQAYTNAATATVTHLR